MESSVVETRHLFPTLRAMLLELLTTLEPDEWSYATSCPGWDVKDVASHLLGVEVGNVSTRRDGWETGAPGGDEELGRWLARHNADWVRAARRLSPRLVCELLEFSGRLLEGYLDELGLGRVDAHVSWASDEPVPVWLDVAREYTERWVHQQQIRDATRRPGAASAEFLSPVLATFVHALPMTYAAVEAAPGTAVALDIVGPGGGSWHIARADDGWTLAVGDHQDPAARVVMEADTAWRLFVRDPQAVPPAIRGDRALGTVMTRSVAIIV
jgi:uncharacterized protein (TIGR03083 family)